MNMINWFEIPAKDFDRAVQFYATILAQDVRKGDFGGIPHGFLPGGDDAVTGAIVLVPEYNTSRDGVVIYLNAGNDIDGILSRVDSAGGSVVMPKMDITPQGFMAQIIDSEGNKIGLHQPPAA